MIASRTTPTLWVLVIATGPSRKPDSSTQVVPVISPLPFCENQPANEGLASVSAPRGRITVTPVRTGPTPTSSAPEPSIRVVWPTLTPATSVIALNGPGVPTNGTPRSRARGRTSLASGAPRTITAAIATAALETLRMCVSLRKQRGDFVIELLGVLRGARFNGYAEDRLGVRGPHVHPRAGNADL